MHNVSRETLCIGLIYNNQMKKPIEAYSIEELHSLFKQLKEPTFRAQQLIEWLYLKNASSYTDMTNLSKALRENLSANYPLIRPKIVDQQVSQDGTNKFVLSYYDGAQVEMVAIPSTDGRLTVCCSSQVGCPMNCSFCATGKEGFTRNLSMGEIVEQVLIAQKIVQTRVSNIVVMGQGEPFLNYNNTISALRTLNSERLLNIGARHITISTCGITSGIMQLGNEPEQFTLAISLHSAVQDTRDTLMPSVSTTSLKQLRQALVQYIQNTNRRVTLEYALIKGINDQPEDLKALESFCEGLLCHINLIPLNKIADSIFQPASESVMNAWRNSLQKNKIEVSVRNSRGSDIAGACGQLKNALKQ